MLPSALPTDTTPANLTPENREESAEDIMRGVTQAMGYNVEVRIVTMY